MGILGYIYDIMISCTKGTSVRYVYVYQRHYSQMTILEIEVYNGQYSWKYTHDCIYTFTYFSNASEVFIM